MGLPCIHRYNQAYESKTTLTVNDFHSQWYWNRPLKDPSEHSIAQSIEQLVNHSIAKLASQLGSQLANQSMDQSTAQPANQLESQLTDQPTSLPISQSIDTLIDLPRHVGEPLKISAKGRLKKPRTAQIGRILSGFERTEAGVRKKRRQCGACHQEGHIRTS
jgi:hypothetical protein